MALAPRPVVALGHHGTPESVSPHVDPEDQMASDTEISAMRRALDAARSVSRTLPNPRVGCVLLAPDGTELAVGVHRGAGTPHAEVDALTRAGDAARGATAVVTLEPCNHIGRTGPCAQALIKAGVARVVFAQTDPGESPDGATTDSEGYLWSARYNGGRVVRHAPDGRVDRVIEVAARQVTCCAFGGPDLGTLFITTATQNLSPAQLAGQPAAGHLLAVEVGVKGLAEHRFAV